MSAFLIFIMLPIGLIVLAWRIKPVVNRDERPHDGVGGGLAAGGMFGHHGLTPDPVSQREETERVKFNLDDVKPRE